MKALVKTPEDFRRQFVPSRPELFNGVSGQIGSEIELYIVREGAVKNPSGPFTIEGMTSNGGELLTSDMFISGADKLLKLLQQEVGERIFPRFVSEFSNCQVEINTSPFADTDRLLEDIERLIILARQVALETFGWDLIGVGLAPDGVPQIPNPSDKRYVRFANKMQKHITDIMFRVAAVQFHVAVETEEELFERYNALVRALPKLRGIGDFTQGMRSRLFETALYPAANPPELRGWNDAFAYYRSLGKLADPKAHWAWVRLSAARVSSSGVPVKPMTVEFRLPDSTTKLKDIWRVAEAVRRSC